MNPSSGENLMDYRMRALRVCGASLAFAGALVASGCGGGGSATPNPSVVSATSSPSPGAPSSPSALSVPAGGGTVALPAAANGQVATLVFAAGAPAGLTLTVTSSATAPGSAPAPSAVRRADAIANAVPFFWVTLTPSATLPASLITSELVTLTSAQPANASYYVEYDDITSLPATKAASFGPGSVANLVATVTSATSPALQSGHTYLLQFYEIPAGSTGGSASISTQPATLSFSAASQSQSLAVNDPGYTGTFTASGCSGIVTAASSASPLTVVSVAAGSCILTLTDSKNVTGTVSITVTTLNVPIQ
jgi:hypothetical protein